MALTHTCPLRAQTSVLCVGSDRHLLETRELLVQELPAEVVSAEDYAEACAAVLLYRFSAAIIGPGFSPQEQEAIRRAICSVQQKVTVLKLSEETIHPSVIAAFLYGMEVGKEVGGISWRSLAAMEFATSER